MAAVITALALSACGSSSKSSSSAAPASSTPATTASSASTTTSASTTSSSTSTSAAAPTGAPIKLGFVCSCSGPQAAQLAGLNIVAKSWEDATNAAGGINGHPVSLVIDDDASNPATSLQDVKAMVTQDHVMAIVGEASLVDATWASYAEKAGIPVVGGISPEASFLTNPDFYPSGANLVMQTVGTIALGKTAHKTHIGIAYCAESPICAEAVPLVQGAAALSGLKVTAIKISSTAPSYAAPCLSLKAAGVDALFVADNSSVVQRMVAACAQQGYTPQTVSQTSTTTNAWLTDKSLDGSLLSGFNANGLDPSNPEIIAFRAAVNKYGNNLTSSPQFGSGAILVWAGGQLFIDAAKAAQIGPTSTGADVKKGLYALKNDTLGGIAAPTTFTPGKPTFIPCYFTQQVKDGKFESLNGNKPTCLSAAETAALVKALHL